MCPLLTFLLANAFVFDNVFMVERLQDVDLAREVGALLLTVLGLQGLHRHELASLVSPGIVATQLHFAEVALHEEQKTIVKELPKRLGLMNLFYLLTVLRKRFKNPYSWSGGVD